MKRTHINLTGPEHFAAKREAARLGIPISELFRRLLLERMPVDQPAPWMRHAGMLASGTPHRHQSIDDVVYGERV